MSTERHDVGIRMPAELHAAVKRRAAEDGLSMAEAMRTALRAYVDAAPDRRPAYARSGRGSKPPTMSQPKGNH